MKAAFNANAIKMKLLLKPRIHTGRVKITDPLLSLKLSFLIPLTGEFMCGSLFPVQKEDSEYSNFSEVNLGAKI